MFYLFGPVIIFIKFVVNVKNKHARKDVCECPPSSLVATTQGISYTPVGLVATLSSRLETTPCAQWGAGEYPL